MDSSIITDRRMGIYADKVNNEKIHKDLKVFRADQYLRSDLRDAGYEIVDCVSDGNW